MRPSRPIRHLLGLALTLVLVAALYGAWTYWPEFTRWEPIRPARGFLTDWRLPILTVAGFLMLTVVEMVYSKTLREE